ncbi:protein LAZ1 [Tanacetum coccineum]
MATPTQFNVDIGNENPSSASPTKGSSAAIVTFDVATPVTKSKFRTLINDEQVANVDVVLPVATLSAAQLRYANSLVGYFVGKNAVFPLVQNYVTNTWGKFGFQKVIKDEDGFLFFKFASLTGLEQGRMGYARALIKVSAEKELKEEVIMAIPDVEAIILTNALNELPNLLRCEKNKPRSTFVYRPKISEPARTMETKSENIDLFKLKYQFDSLRNQDDTIMETEVGDSSRLNKETTVNDSDSESGVEELEICSKVFRTWDWTSNASLYSKGCRIILSNNPSTRRTLWSDLEMHKLVTRGVPWTLMGDVNLALNLEDYSSSSSKLSSAISDFKDCVYNIEVMDFKELVSNAWNMSVEGHKMFQVVSKLKSLKKPFQKLLHDHGNLHDRVNKLRMELDPVQKALDLNPSDVCLREEEAIYVQAFVEAKLDEERFLKQKAKIKWLDVGDSNFAYFHMSVKCQNHRGRIDTIMNSANKEVTGMNVADVFVLGESSINMVKLVSDEEIKAAMFSIGDDRAPGPDGFSSAFFKKGWDIVGGDVCHAIRDFFVNDRLLKEISHTFIALIPKVPTPLKVNDFRPISCCNVLYKCISKILTNRIINGIKEVIDIQKAYDTVDWHFLGCILACFGFHSRMIKWIMACVTSTSFSLSLNGDIHGYFKGKRRLRQGDLLSPYLFKMISLLFSGDVDSARVIMEALEEFKCTSGLVPSLPKSTVFFFNVSNHVKLAILSIMPFSEGDLPVKYLGVPLISSRLLNKDCKILVDRVKNRIGDWKNKSLSFAGRLQLCSSVLSSMPVYWASVLMLPKGTIYDIQSLIRGFLWCNGELKRRRARVAWDDICLPKQEGGIGLRSFDVFNMALMLTHIWNIVSKKESLWVRWIHTYKIRNQSFWSLPLTKDVSWGWLKLLQLREQNLDVHSHDAYRWRGLNGSFLISWSTMHWDAFGPVVLVNHECLKPLEDSVEAMDVGNNVDLKHAWYVWKLVHLLADMESVQPILHDTISYIQPVAHKRTVRSIFGKLSLAAATYFVWLERNNRLFKKTKKIIPPKIRTRSTCQPAAELLGGGMGLRVGRGGWGRRPMKGNDDRVDDLNGQGNDQEHLTRHVGLGCSYKEFLACNPKEYDGKGGVVVLTRWIEKMENVEDTSSCSNDQKVKYTAGSFVGKVLTWWNSHIRMLSREVVVSMSWNDFKFNDARRVLS